MTEDEKKKLRAGFVKKKPEEEGDDPWTEEELIEAAKRIIKRLGLEGQLQ